MPSKKAPKTTRLHSLFISSPSARKQSIYKQTFPSSVVKDVQLGTECVSGVKFPKDSTQFILLNELNYAAAIPFDSLVQITTTILGKSFGFTIIHLDEALEYDVSRVLLITEEEFFTVIRWLAGVGNLRAKDFLIKTGAPYLN